MTRLASAAALLLTLLGSAGSAAAQGNAPRPLTVEEVLSSVNRHYPALRAALRDNDVAEAELKSAEGAFDPSLKASVAGDPVGYYSGVRAGAEVQLPTPWWGSTFWAGYGWGANDFPSYYGNYVTNRAGEARVGASVPLWRNGPIDRRRASVERAELGRTLASLGVEQQRVEIVRAATLRYWDWVAAGQRRRVAEALLFVAEQRDAAMAARVKHGDIPQIERTDNARSIVQRQGLVIGAEREVERAAIELSLFLRDEGGRPLVVGADRLPPSLPEPTGPDPEAVDRDLEAAPRARYEVRRLAVQQQQNEVERSLAKNQMAPAIDVRVQAVNDFGVNPDPTNKSRNQPELQLGLSVDIPLRNRANEGRVKAAEATIARLGDQKKLAEDRATAEVRDALSALSAARKRVAAAAREVALAVEVEAAERQKFELGDSTLLMVNLREQATTESRIREVEARLDFQRSLAAYRAATLTQDRP